MKTYINFLNETKGVSNSAIDTLIKNARKWKEIDFIEEYVYLNDINIDSMKNINKDDIVNIIRIKKDVDGKTIYNNKTGRRENIPFKTVVAEKDYGDKQWDFIMNHTEELQEEAKILYKQNKNIKKPKFNDTKTITAFHASKNKFNQFKYDMEKPTQIGADEGFFFFLNIKNAQYLASIIKDNYGEAFIYTATIQTGKQLELNGEDIGTNWGRQAELSQANIEGYNTVIIKDADTGYGITDELIVFDDDNINIKKIDNA